MKLDKFYDENELIVMDDGIYGFEEYKKFIPLPLEENNHDSLCLYSIDNVDVSFFIMNPFVLDDTYEPVLSEDDYQKLGTDNEENLSYFVICSLRDSIENSSVNMKCPIVVNTKTRKGIQTVLDTQKYSLRHKFQKVQVKEL